MLWQIEGSNTYLLGSIHLTNLRPLRMSAVAEQAFARASCVVFEADPDGLVDRSPFLLPAGVSLNHIVPDALFRAARAHWHRLGLPESELLIFHPGFVAMRLQAAQAIHNGYELQLGIDHVLRDRSKRAGKDVRNLELAIDQVRMLTTSPVDEQISLLGHITNQNDAGYSELAGMVSAWSNGDVQHFEDLIEQRLAHWPRTFDTLITKRNQNWVSEIVELAKSGKSSLVVVGQLHLVGATGVPALLQRQGLRVALRRDA